MPAWNALLAAGFRAIRPLAVRAQLPHFFVEDPVCPTSERRSDRAADRGALRGAERAVLRLVEAHVGNRPRPGTEKLRQILQVESFALKAKEPLHIFHSSSLLRTMRSGQSGRPPL